VSPQSADRPRRPWWRRIPFGRIFLGLIALLIVGGLAFWLVPRPMLQTESIAVAETAREIEPLRPVSNFDTISDVRARSVALFEEAGRVIQHPRCMNCHPASDRPTQTDAMRPHIPWVTRGEDGHGEATMRCATCHLEENYEPSGVPGDPEWHLAPIEMAWQGFSLGEICEQLLDPARSGMNREELQHHMAEDHLVGWAWNPGGNRTPAPGTQAEFGELIQAWLDTGGECPS
jgi:hypothetical protein